MVKEIGGYFELECMKGNHYHEKAIKLNSARYSIQYILQVKKYKKIYIPYYSCESILQPSNNLGIDIEFYNINENLMPILKCDIYDDEVLLFINYFGLNNNKIREITKKYKNIIIDNTQAFYTLPFDKIDTIYSPRKFFGVSDGGYLYTDSPSISKLQRDISYSRYEYLLKRIDLGATEGYLGFRENEIKLNNQEILQMSKLTSKILSNINYEYVKLKREKNFSILHDKLKDINELKNIDESLSKNGPMIYPFLISKDNIKKYLIDNKIYVATYWPEVISRVQTDSYEAYLTNKLIPLPIDQRYDDEDMMYILKKIWEII